ncbi:MAG: hypothetical protein R2939_12650 [Kofleriaceae bacterium]
MTTLAVNAVDYDENHDTPSTPARQQLIAWRTRPWNMPFQISAVM